MSQPRDLTDTSPCVGCGLCCNGTLYSRAKASSGEEPRLEEFGLSLLADGAQTYFALPCQWEKCGSCSIYESRFDICRSFRCALLRQYHAGDISEDDAKAVVKTARELLEKVAELTPDAKHTVSRAARRRQLARELEELKGGATEDEARKLIAIIALDAFLDRWFRTKKPAEVAS